MDHPSMQYFKEIWKDPVWSKVISIGIITLITVMIPTLLNLWPDIQLFLKLIWSFLTSSTITSNWLLILMAIPCFLVLGAVLFSLIGKLIRGSCSSDYVKDNFEGLTWCWNYHDQQIIDLHCLCPKCQYEIIPEHGHNYKTGGLAYMYSCEECGYEVPPVTSDDGLDQKIELKIQKKLRTGERRRH
jgi:predicted RNA-binding Zn-ribbon protein involved in translation (DUF1610 family)